MEMTPDEILNDWGHAEVDLGLETIIAHLDSGRTLTQQLDEFRREAVTRLQTDEYIVDWGNEMRWVEDEEAIRK